MNTKRTSWTLILDPFLATIDILSVLRNNGKSLRCPSIYSSTLSRTSKVPKDQPLNLSVATSSIVIWNSLYDDVVGIPVVPPTSTVRISPLPYAYPVFLISKSIILDPWPTTISIVASVPKPDNESELYLSGKLE